MVTVFVNSFVYCLAISFIIRLILVVIFLLSSMLESQLRVASFNCRSAKTSVTDISSLCESHDIIVLQETWLLPHDLNFLNLIHSDFLAFGTSAVDTREGCLVGRPFGGLAFLWRKALGNAVSVKNFNDPRMLGLLVSGADVQCMLIDVYMPTAVPENYDLYQDYLGRISAIITECGHGHVIIPGDWNARNGRVEFEWVEDFCFDSDLVMTDVNRLPIDTFTYVSDSHQTVSWIDHVIMSTPADRICVDMRVVYDLVTSDHRPLSFSLNVGELHQVSDFRAPPSVRIPWEKLSYNSKLIYAEKVNTALDGISLPIDVLLCPGCDCNLHKHSLTNYYESINQVLLTSSKCFETVSSSNFPVVAGWNDLVSEAHRVARADFLEWRRVGQPRQGPASDAMRLSRARFKYALRACRANVEQLQADGLARSLLDKDYQLFWKQVQKKSGQSAPATLSIDGHSGTENIGEFWKGHYENLLNSVSRPDHSAALRDCLASSDQENVSWSAEEIARYRKDLKVGKAVGMDGVSPEHLRFGPAKLDIHLALIFNSFVRHCFLPTSFMPVKITPIVKSATGDISSSKNYRPVAIATAGSKIFESAILDKVLAIREVPVDNQFGFTKGCSTDQCIFLLKERIRRYVQLEGMVYCCFLDASKAFDRVCHDTLFLQLINYGIPTSVVRILKFWYSEQVMHISWNGYISSGFGTGNGVRQGGLLSPGLFNLYVNILSLHLNKLDIGCYLNTVRVNHLIYADDICLISPSLAGLRKLLRVSESVGDFLSINFNPDKSVCMRFSPNSYRNLPLFDVCLNGNPLAFVERTRYLGHIISSDLSDAADMEKTKRAIYARGNLLVRKFAPCSEHVKINLFRAYMTPLYCSHLWVKFTRQNFNVVRTAYNAIFRKLFGISRFESARMNLVGRNLPCLDQIIRKSTCSLFQRLAASSNVISNDVDNLVTIFSFIGQSYFRRFMCFI